MGRIIVLEIVSRVTGTMLWRIRDALHDAFLYIFQVFCKVKFLPILTPGYSLYHVSIAWTPFIFTQLVFLGFRRWPNNFLCFTNRMILFQIFSCLPLDCSQ